MVAPSYAARRSTLAKELGLGRKRSTSGRETPDTNNARTAEVTATTEEPLFPADVADNAKAGRHTAESVFGNFGKGGAPKVGRGKEEDAPTPVDAVPRKRGRKPFAEQSVRAIRGRRVPTAS